MVEHINLNIITALQEIKEISERSSKRRNEQSLDDDRLSDLTKFIEVAKSLGPMNSTVVEVIGIARARTIKETLLSNVADLLSDGEPRTVSQLVESLEQREISVNGKDPAQNLSVYLSRAKDQFDLKHGLGWTIKRQSVNQQVFSAFG